MNSNDETKQINNLNNCIMKQFTLKSLMLLLLLLIGGGSYAWGETKTYQHVFNAKPKVEKGVTLSEMKWDIVATNLNGYNSQNYAGVQIGTSKKDGSVTLTSSADWNYKNATKITAVRLWLNLGGTSVTPSVTIGGKNAVSDGTKVVKNSKAGNDWTKATKVTFTPAEDGNTGVVVINVSSVKAGYICAMEIDCEDGAPAANLTSIAVSGTPTKITYFDGEPFDPTGLVVTGTYDDGTQKEITDGIVWVKDPEILKLGTTSVDVKASVGNITSNIYTVTGITVKEKVTLIGIEANGTPAEFWKGDKFNHDGITVTAHWSDESESDVTEQCQFTEPDMNTAGTKTVTVTYENETCPYEIEVKTIENTKETAYTVSEAIASIDAGKDLASQVYVKGIVSKIVTPFESKYGNVSFDVSVDGSINGQQFRFFRTQKDAENIYTEDPNIEVGATVIGCGTLDKYNDIYEFKAGNYLVDYKAPVEKVLKSIAISGEATKTTYFEGETFDPTGLVVTATYEDESTEVVTGRVKWTFNPETLILGTTEVNVTATYGEKTASKTVAVTVTEAPKTVDIDLTKDQTTTATTDKLEWLGEFVTVTANKAKAGTDANNYYPGTTGKTYTSTRFYSNSTLTFAPAPFVVLGEITYEATTDKHAAAMEKSTWTNATAKANGKIVTITPEDGSKPVSAVIKENTGGSSFSIAYSLVEECSLTLAAKSDDGSYYATFSSASACEFAGADVFTVNVEGKNIVLNEVESKQVPANTGVLLKSAQNNVIVTRLESAPAIEGTNLLKPASEKMTEGFKFYKLAYDNFTEKTGLGFYWGAAEGGAFTVKPGLAYLAVPQAQAANVKGFSFDGPQTGINGVEATTAKGAIYNLNGQRVEKAQRGIYIQNGKKFIVK